MPTTSDIAITVAGNNITNRVLFSSASFNGQLGAVPGTADFTVKDPLQELDFTTGDRVTLEIDGVLLWGGYLVNVQRVFAFPVVDTSSPGTVKVRQWKLSALDNSILFDKRVIHNPAEHLKALPFFTLGKTMGELLRDELFASYLDIVDDDLDTTTFVDDMYVPRFDVDGNPDPDGTKNGAWPQQGSYWRAAMDQFAQFGAIYYIDAARNVHFHAGETTVAPWGFSDVPNKNPLPDPAATYGMREFEEIDDASAMANDAFVWGGSELSGASGGTVFARSQNAGSIAAHRRWQFAESRFGELGDQGLVQARANVIVSGNTTGAVGGDTSRGLAVDQQQVRLAWFGHDVPLDGTRQHLRPGDVVTMQMYVLGVFPDPLVLILPLRTLKITFPTLPASGTPEAPLTYVRFDGFFGVQMSDPFWLWKFLRDLKASTPVSPLPIATVGDGDTTTVYGAYGTFTPTPVPDDTTTVFTLPFAYINGSLLVYMNGLLLTPGVDFTESTPESGEFTIPVAPLTGAALVAICRVAGGI